MEAVYSLASRRSSILGGEPLEGIIAWFLHNSCYNGAVTASIRDIMRARLVSLLQHVSAPQPHRSRNSNGGKEAPPPAESAALSKSASGSLSKSGGVPTCAFGKPLAKLVKSAVSGGKGPADGSSLYWPFRVVLMTRAMADGGYAPIGKEVRKERGSWRGGGVSGVVWGCAGFGVAGVGGGLGFGFCGGWPKTRGRDDGEEGGGLWTHPKP